MRYTDDVGYQEIRNEWVPSHVYVCTEVWSDDLDAVVMVYLDFEARCCVLLRFFCVMGEWNVSVDLQKGLDDNGE